MNSVPATDAVSTVPTTAAARLDWMRVAATGYLLLLPGVAFWLMNFTAIKQNGTLDPYIYTGYIHNFEDLFTRYGATYYGVRFGLILPGQLASAIFGEFHGYFAYRYALALAASVPFFVFVRQRFGAGPALASCSVLVTSPYLARTILWDHPDASGVPFLFAAICLVLIEHERRWMLDLAAGAFGAMAIHSNVFVAAPLGIFVGSYALLWVVWRRSVRVLVTRLAVLASGMLLVTGGGIAYYWLSVGHWNIFSATLAVTAWLVAGGTGNWRTEGVEWVTEAWWVLTPVALSLMTMLARAWRRVEFHDAVIWVGATGTWAFFYVYQFSFNGNSLELFYYFSYALPGIFLLLATTLGALWTPAASAVASGARGALFVGAAAGPWVLYSFGLAPFFPEDFTQHMIVVGLACALVLFASSARVFRPGAAVVASAALGLMFFSSFARPLYASMIATRQERDTSTDVYQVALQFMDAIPRWSERPGHIRFWYTNEPPGNMLQSIQSTFLWGFSKIQGSERGLPYLGPSELELLGAPGMKWLSLLAEKPEQLELGRSALSNNGIRFTHIDRKVLTSGAYTMYLELLELQPPH